jgi:hypothetical protein
MEKSKEPVDFLKPLNIGYCLERYLKLKKWKSVHLQRETGIPASAISDMLTGKRSNPGRNHLSAIILYTDIHPYFLMTGRGPMLRSKDENQGDSVKEPSTDYNRTDEKVVKAMELLASYPHMAESILKIMEASITAAEALSDLGLSSSPKKAS